MTNEERKVKLQGQIKSFADKEKLSDEEAKELDGLIARLKGVETQIVADGIAADVIAAEEEAAQKAIDEQIKIGIERIMAEKEPAVKNPGNDTKVDVTKDEADQPFPTGGEFFQAVKNAAIYPTREDVRLKSLSLKATGLSEGVPADGGYLLQPGVAGGILERR